MFQIPLNSAFASPPLHRAPRTSPFEENQAELLSNRGCFKQWDWVELYELLKGQKCLEVHKGKLCAQLAADFHSPVVNDNGCLSFLCVSFLFHISLLTAHPIILSVCLSPLQLPYIWAMQKMENHHLHFICEIKVCMHIKAAECLSTRTPYFTHWKSTKNMFVSIPWCSVNIPILNHIYYRTQQTMEEPQFPSVLFV